MSPSVYAGRGRAALIPINPGAASATASHRQFLQSLKESSILTATRH
jgi:hypothetical protein